MKNSLYYLKTRFKKIKEIEELEIKNTSIGRKFLQLTSLILLAKGMGVDISKNRNNQMTANNWAAIKSL